MGVADRAKDEIPGVVSNFGRITRRSCFPAFRRQTVAPAAVRFSATPPGGKETSRIPGTRTSGPRYTRMRPAKSIVPN